MLGPEGEIPRDAADGAAAAASLYAIYMKAGGDRRTEHALRQDGLARIGRVRARGYDLGYGHGSDYSVPPAAAARMEMIYAHARRALYAVLDDGVVRDVSPGHLRVRTRARDRDEYLARPGCGEAIRDDDATALLALRGSAVGDVQIVISDGLNANALNQNLRSLLPPLRLALAAAGTRVSQVDVVIEDGRVRAGYHVGALLGADTIVHLIGERPGTGLDTLSAYLTYGRDRRGAVALEPRSGSRGDDRCVRNPSQRQTAGRRRRTRSRAPWRRILEQRVSGVALRA